MSGCGCVYGLWTFMVGLADQIHTIHQVTTSASGPSGTKELVEELLLELLLVLVLVIVVELLLVEVLPKRFVG